MGWVRSASQSHPVSERRSAVVLAGISAAFRRGRSGRGSSPCGPRRHEIVPELLRGIRARINHATARSWAFEPQTRSTRVPVHLSSPVARSRPANNSPASETGVHAVRTSRRFTKKSFVGVFVRVVKTPAATCRNWHSRRAARRRGPSSPARPASLIARDLSRSSSAVCVKIVVTYSCAALAEVDEVFASAGGFNQTSPI